MTNNSPTSSFYSMVKGNKEPVKETRDDAPSGVIEDESDEPPMTLNEGSITDVIDQGDAFMPHEARRVLVHLMRQGTVMASQKPKLFQLLCRYEDAIRKHLSEVYLQLILDQKTGVAFVASSAYQNDCVKGEASDGFEGGSSQGQDDLELDESTTLIPRRTLSLYDTLILLVLRKHYQDRESAGEQKITIDIERIESYLTPFLPITDHASLDRKKLLARVKALVSKKVLATIRGVEERYEITPIIRYVVSASFLESMLDEYMLLAEQAECVPGQQNSSREEVADNE